MGFIQLDVQHPSARALTRDQSERSEVVHASMSQAQRSLRAKKKKKKKSDFGAKLVIEALGSTDGNLIKPNEDGEDSGC